MRSLRHPAESFAILLAGLFVAGPSHVLANVPSENPAEAELENRFYIRHFKILGASKLPAIDVEKAVYPFMGPNCTPRHVESARKALEEAYRATGYKTVTVSVPQQDAALGVIKLQVNEGGVQRLRVRGARYFDPTKIAAKAGSLREGTVPNFNDVTKDIVALNKNGDAVVLPKLNPTDEPGEFDVDLHVKDKLPLHGTVEINNRNSPDTTELRVNAGLSYSNLWLAGHTIGGNAQVAPERPDDALVYSGYYIAPLGDGGANLMLMGTKQDSDISTLGGAAVRGKGYVLGARLNFPLPGTNSWKTTKEGEDPEWTPDNFFHSLSLGVDYKHFTEDLQLGENAKFTPIDYFPVSLSYGASWVEKQHSTEFNTTFTAGTRGFGSDMLEFDNKRYLATGGFFHVKSDLSHTHDVGKVGQVFGKVQGQWASQPLINNEQFSGGGLGNARGYLESTVLGDNAIFGTLEVRTPNLLAKFEKKPETPPEAPADPLKQEPQRSYEWRFHAFVDGGILTLNEPLPEQDDQFSLLSVGVGTRFNLNQSLQGSLDAGFPLRKSGTIDRGDWLLTFRMWTAF